jgi:hypothetical protein
MASVKSASRNDTRKKSRMNQNDDQMDLAELEQVMQNMSLDSFVDMMLELARVEDAEEEEAA